MSAARNRGRVLVIDDDGLVLSAIRRCLRGHCDATCTTDADEALALLGRNAFDVVICDLYMPKLTGRQLLLTASARIDASIASRFVMMTGATNDDQYDRSIVAACAAHLTKPFSARELRGVIEAIKRRHNLS